MKIKNKIKGWESSFFRKAIVWVCKQYDLKLKRVRIADFRNTSSAWSGCAYRNGEVMMRWNPNYKGYPILNHTYGGREIDLGYPIYDINDAIEGLIHLIAHEICHIHQYSIGYYKNRSTAEGEKYAEKSMLVVLEAFRKDRESLLSSWHAVAERRAAKPRPSIIDERARRANAQLAYWQSRMKAAKTKVQKYQRRVNYYSKKTSTPMESQS